MTKLSANTDRSAKLETTRSAKNVATIARPPSSGGSSAATSERKNSSDSSRMIGKASSSACARSWPTLVFTCALATATPPSLHVALTLESVLDLLRGVLQRLVRERLEVREHVRRAAVARRPSLGCGCCRSCSPRATSGPLAQLVRDLVHAGARGCRCERRPTRPARPRPGRSGGRRRLVAVLRLHALGRGIVRSVGLRRLATPNPNAPATAAPITATTSTRLRWAYRKFASLVEHQLLPSPRRSAGARPRRTTRSATPSCRFRARA